MPRPGGYDSRRPGYMYLMARGSERQIGITGEPQRRLATHRRDGWQLIEVTAAMPGDQAAAIERQIKRHLRHQRMLLPGSTEKWDGNRWNPGSLQQIWQQTGVYGGYTPRSSYGGQQVRRFNYKPPAEPRGPITRPAPAPAMHPATSASLDLAITLIGPLVGAFILWLTLLVTAAFSPWVAGLLVAGCTIAASNVNRLDLGGWGVFAAVCLRFYAATLLVALGPFAVFGAAILATVWISELMRALVQRRRRIAAERALASPVQSPGHAWLDVPVIDGLH